MATKSTLIRQVKEGKVTVEAGTLYELRDLREDILATNRSLARVVNLDPEVPALIEKFENFLDKLEKEIDNLS
jgi:hypothetical protein